MANMLLPSKRGGAVPPSTAVINFAALYLAVIHHGYLLAYCLFPLFLTTELLDSGGSGLVEDVGSNSNPAIHLAVTRP